MNVFEAARVSDLLSLAAKSAGSGKLTAGGTGDNTKVTGTTLDRLSADGVKLHKTAKFTFAGQAVLAAAATLAVAVEIQDSADGQSWNTAVPLQTSTVEATGAGGGSTEQPAFELNVDLGTTYARYVRFNVTPDLSAANTDTATWGAAVQWGAYNRLPPNS
jgi:hypothetical protein